jgi:hypothetical protein
MSMRFKIWAIALFKLYITSVQLRQWAALLLQLRYMTKRYATAIGPFGTVRLGDSSC